MILEVLRSSQNITRPLWAKDQITSEVEAFKRRKKGTEIGGRKQKLHLLRIGKYKPGETIKASLQLTDSIDPPNLNRSRAIRYQQNLLLNTIKAVLKSIHPDSEDAKKVAAVVEWINMPELKEDIEAYSTTTDDDTPTKSNDEKDSPNAAAGISALSLRTYLPIPPYLLMPSTPLTEHRYLIRTCVKIVLPPRRC